MFSGQFYEMWVSIWERKIKSLLETFMCIISAVETSNCRIATERSTNITVRESTTCITAIEPQDLHNFNRRCQQHKYYRKSQLHT